MDDKNTSEPQTSEATAPKDSSAPETPNAHNMEPLAPPKPTHKRLDLILGVVFALLAIVFAVALYFVGNEPVEAPAEQSQEVITLEDQAQDESQMSTVEDFRNSLADYFVNSQNQQEEPLNITEEGGRAATVRVQDTSVFTSVPAFFYVDIAFSNPSLNPEQQQVLATPYRTSLTDYLQTQGLAISPDSVDPNGANETAVKYENQSVVCEIGPANSQISRLMTAQCYSTESAEESVRGTAEFIESLQANGFSLDTPTFLSLVDTQSETTNKYERVGAVFGNEVSENNGVFGPGDGGGRIAFYRLSNSEEFEVFEFGNSTPLCTAFDTETLQNVFAEEPCNNEANPAAGQTVGEFYSQELSTEEA